MSNQDATAPGWRPDPTGRHDLRWWDGSRWTDRVAARAAEAVDPYDDPDATMASSPYALRPWRRSSRP